MGLYELAPAVMVPLILFTFIGAIIIVPMVLRSNERSQVHQTLRRYHDNGETPPPELLAALSPESSILTTLFNRPQAELRRGLVLIAVALAMVVLACSIDLGSSNYEVVWPLVGSAAFPGLIGVASLIMWQVGLRAPRD